MRKRREREEKEKRKRRERERHVGIQRKTSYFNTYNWTLTDISETNDDEHVRKISVPSKAN